MISQMVPGNSYIKKKSQRLKLFDFQVQGIINCGPNEANENSITDRDVNVFKVSGNLKK